MSLSRLLIDSPTNEPQESYDMICCINFTLCPEGFPNNSVTIENFDKPMIDCQFNGVRLLGHENIVGIRERMVLVIFNSCSLLPLKETKKTWNYHFGENHNGGISATDSPLLFFILAGEITEEMHLKFREHMRSTKEDNNPMKHYNELAEFLAPRKHWYLCFPHVHKKVPLGGLIEAVYMVGIY